MLFSCETDSWKRLLIGGQEEKSNEMAGCITGSMNAGLGKTPGVDERERPGML